MRNKRWWCLLSLFAQLLAVDQLGSLAVYDLHSGELLATKRVAKGAAVGICAIARCVQLENG